MDQFIEVHWTAGSIDEARQVARLLVQERLVACAQIVPWIESIYIWNNELNTTQESKVIFKTHANLFDKVRTHIEKHAKYEVPEILVHPIKDGNASYLNWMNETLGSHAH